MTTSLFFLGTFLKKPCPLVSGAGRGMKNGCPEAKGNHVELTYRPFAFCLK